MSIFSSIDFDVLLGKLGLSSSAPYHIYSGLVWSLLWGHLIRLSAWCWLSLPFWVGLILYRELWVERAQPEKKTIEDVWTKLIGVVAYGLVFIK